MSMAPNDGERKAGRLRTNLPRYIDSAEPEDPQDIDDHLRGGIPERDLDALGAYWKVMPALRAGLFEPLRPDIPCPRRRSPR